MAVSRQYHQTMIHFIRKTLAYTNTTETRMKGRVPSGAMLIPAISGAHVTTLFDATSAVVDIGGWGGPDDPDYLATDLDVSSVGLKTLDSAYGVMLLTQELEPSFTYADSGAAATGAAEIALCYMPDTDE
jgi:hypothetical protein